MKQIWLIWCLILGVSGIYSPVAGSEIPFISVIGEARERVAPDQMNWTLMVRNEGKNVKAVAQEHSQLTKELLSYLIRSGVREQQVQTSSMQLAENWVYQKGTRVRQGYFAATIVAFTTTDLQSYETLWIGLSGLKNLSIRGVHYDLSDQTGYLNRIRNQALADAKRKAVSMAAALDAEIGEPLMIEEEPALSPQPFLQRSSMKQEMLAQAPSGDSMAMPGLIPVTLAVRVKFRLVSLSEP